MRHHSLVITICTVLILPLDLWASIISIAPLQIHSEEDVQLSGRRISEKIALGNLYLSYAGSGAEDISNILEASSYCEKEGIGFIIYGSLTRHKFSDSVEMRFYNHSSRSIEQVFYGSDDSENSDRLISDMKFKIHNYLVEELALYEKKEEDEKQSLMTVPLSAGYWLPLDRTWRDLTVSLFSIKSGILLNPFEDILSTDHLDVNFHYGISLLYELGLNDPQYEKFYQHKLKLLLPVELSLTIVEKHRVSLIFSPLYQLDILSKTRNYEEEKVELSSGFGFSSGLTYHYNFSRRFSAGLGTHFDFIFYDNPQINFRPEFSFLIHCGKLEKGTLSE